MKNSMSTINPTSVEHFIRPRIHKILTMPMDRKKFLQVFGLACLAVFGISRIVALLESHEEPAPRAGGYGGSR